MPIGSPLLRAGRVLLVVVVLAIGAWAAGRYRLLRPPAEGRVGRAADLPLDGRHPACLSFGRVRPIRHLRRET
jgi:hypothetical protein